MAVVGSAEVIVRAITSQVRDQIKRAFKDARPDVQAAGRQAGDDYATEFGKRVQVGLKDALNGAFEQAGQQAAAKAGKNAADAFGENFVDGVNSKVDLSSAADKAKETFDGSGTADEIVEEFSSEFELGMAGAGRRGGDAFGRGFLNSGFANSATAASRQFTVMLAVGNIVGPAIGGLVSAISAAVSGLYAMASAASVAAGALATLPAMMGAAIQAAGTLKLAFSGVGEAIKLGFESEEIQDTGAATAAAAYAVADARKALAQAYQQSADAAYDAADRVADAERDVADAQQEVLDVQRELNIAREEAAENLQQLAFSAEDAALAEERAALRLKDAHMVLQAVKNLPPDHRVRQEAELAFKEAELNYRQAKDRSNDLEEQQKKAARAGIEGSEEVVAVREKINSAQEKLASSEEALAEARLAQQRQERDSAQAIADAQERVRRAVEAASGAQSEAAKAAKAYNDELAKLSPQARTFVRYLVSLKDEFKGLKDAAGAELFPGLQRGLEPIVNDLFPRMERHLRVTGRLLGEAAEGIGQVFNTKSGENRFGQIMEDNNRIIEVFATNGEKGENTFSALLRVLMRLLHAVNPLAVRFAEWIDEVIRGWRAATNTRKEMEKLTNFFNKAGDRAALLGDIFGNIWGILVNLGTAADDAGVSLLESFEKATGELEKWLGKDATQDKLAKSFEQIADNLRDIGDLAVVIGEEFFKLGDNPAIGEAAEALEPFFVNLGKIFDELTDSGPALSEFATAVSEMFLALTQSDGIDKFLKSMTWVVDLITSMLSSDAGKWALGVAASIAAITRVASLTFRILGFFFKALIGGPIAVVKGFGKFLGFFKKMPGIGGGLTRVSERVRTAFRRIGFGSDSAKRALERQMVTDKAKKDTLRLLEVQALKTAQALGAVKAAGAPAAGAAAKAAPGAAAATGAGAAAAAGAAPASKAATAATAASAASVGKSTGKLSKFGKIAGALAKGPFKLLKFAFLGIGRGLLAILGPIGIVIGVGWLLYKFFQRLYKQSPEFRKFIDALVEKFRELGDWFKKVLDEHIIPKLNDFFGWLNDNIPKIKDFFSDLGRRIKRVANAIKEDWQDLKERFNRIKTAWNEDVAELKELWKSFQERIGKVVSAVKEDWKEFQDKLKQLKENFEKVVDRVKDAWEDFGDKIKDVIDKIKDKWADFKDGFRRLKDDILEKVNLIKTKFSEIRSAVAGAFSGLGSAAKAGINTFIDFLNRNLIDKINIVTSKFGLDIPHIPGLAEGGLVTGRGGPTEDNQIRRLSVGEYVVKAASTKAVGPQTIEYINRYGRLPNAGPGARGGTGGPLDAISDWAKKGAGFALDKLINTVQSLMGTVGLGREGSGFTLTNWFHGILDKLGEVARDWGSNAEAAQKASKSAFKAPGLGPGPYYRPIGRYSITQGYEGQYPLHNGVDLAAPRGTQVHAIAAAVVKEIVSSSRSYGNRVLLNHSAYDTLSAHLDAFAQRLYVGQKIPAGALIGYSGNTGRSTGPHLHFEVRSPGSTQTWDPLEFLRRRGVRLADGGIARATPGGILSVIGEAGRNERIEPLDRQGLSARDRALVELIRDTIANGRGGGDSYHVYPSQGMNEVELANKVVRQVRFTRRRGL